MPAETRKLAVLFADICGSTALYEKLGDQRARLLISRCIFILKSALKTHDGTLVKTIGDEILCTFPTAEVAMNAACEMQMAIKTDNQSSHQPMYVRIGFNYGEVICEEGDIFGDTVNVASRVAGITRASQIMTTAVVADLLPLSVHDKLRKILRTDIKGKQEQQDIYQVMWELEDMGSTRIGMSAYRKPVADVNKLTLNFGNKSCTIDETNNKVLLGRDDKCEVVIKNDFVSRQHATLELKFGKFILTDHSSNGTFLRSSDGVLARVNREETPLHGRGMISLGQPYSDNPSDLIEFSISAGT
jgi:adenylate cyclase